MHEVEVDALATLLFLLSFITFYLYYLQTLPDTYLQEEQLRMLLLNFMNATSVREIHCAIVHMGATIQPILQRILMNLTLPPCEII